MKKLLLCTVWFICIVMHCIAQPLTSPLRFTNYTVAEGLPSNNVNDVMQDSRGFLWFSTAQGLARFDGSRFTINNHSSKDSNSMPFDNINKCVELGNHELLFISGTRLWMLNPVNGRQHPPAIFWQKKGFADFFLLKENLMAITINAKTYFTDLNLDIIDSLKNPIPDNHQVLYLGNETILFESHHKAVAYSLTNKGMEEWKLESAANDGSPIFYFEDVDTLNKHIYLRGGGYGVTEMSYDKASADYLKRKRIQHSYLFDDGIASYKNGICFIANGQGLNVLDPKQPEIIAQNIPGIANSILPSDHYKTYADNAGNYWSACHVGISRFNLQQLNYQSWKLPYPAITSHYTKYDGKIWMSDERYGSYYLDRTSQTFHIIDSSILQYCWGATPVNNQIYIHGSSMGQLHPPYLSKLIIYSPQTKKISNSTFLESFVKNDSIGIVTLVYQAKNGDVWYSINGGGGLVRQQSGISKFTQYSESNHTPSFHFRYVNKAAEDINGNIYFTVNKKSDVLVWKNATQHFEEWKIDSIVPVKNIHLGPLFCHIIDGQQNLWISYEQGGLVKYNLATRKVKLYTTEDGLPTNIFDNMVADTDANIWIPSPRGLYCLLAATDKFIRFTERDGLPFTDFSNSSLFFDGADSSLYFSNVGVLYSIKTYKLLQARRQNAPKLFIDAMQVNGKPYYFTNNQTIELQPNENNLQFSFVLLDLTNNTNFPGYEYCLVNKQNDTSWQTLNASNTIVFNELAAGDYTLQVRIANQYTQGYIYSRNSFHFTIAGWWYNTSWFIFICLSVFAFVAWMIIRFYYSNKLKQQQAIIDKQKALENERSRIAADMHDDVGAGLSRIRYISSTIQEGKNISAADADKIMSLSDESVEKMNEIIWSLNQGNRNLDELIYYIRGQCATMVSNADLEFICELPAAIPQINMEWNESRNIYMVVKEAVNNAVKHAAATSISLDFLFQNNAIITIADNGKGYDAAAANKEGNGLKNYKKRVAALNGTFSIETSVGMGTKVVFCFPLPL